jgi:hypothetical protein
MLVAGIAALIGRLLARIPEKAFEAEGHAWIQIAKIISNRGVTWAIVGAALAAWLGARTKRSDIPRLVLVGAVVGVIAGAIGGAIWGARVYLPATDLEPDSQAANAIQILALAVTGGFLGALIGWLWRPSRRGVGLLTGVATAVLLQLLVNGLEWNSSSQPGNELDFALAAVAVTGAVLATLLALDRQGSETGARVSVSAAEP